MILAFLRSWHSYIKHKKNVLQAYDMSRDHKPDLQAEKERITNAGGYVRCGRVNGTLNMSRAIGI